MSTPELLRVRVPNSTGSNALKNEDLPYIIYIYILHQIVEYEFIYNILQYFHGES